MFRLSFVAVFLAALVRAIADGVVIGPRGGTSHGVAEGELLIAELNCTACHSASEAESARLKPRKSPVLGNTGMKLTPQYLRSYLAAPQIAKPGTTMPDMVHHLSVEERTETVDALVHYLLSEQSLDNSPGIGAEDHLIRQGRALYHTVGCVACHSPQTPPDAVPGLTPEDPKLEEFDISLAVPASVPLGDLARKTTAEELAKFLLDPVTVRPSGRMPSLLLTRAEATSISVYLLRGQAAGLKDPYKRVPISGLKYQYYEENFDSNTDFESLTPNYTGTTPNFDTTLRRRDNSFGFRYSGNIRVPVGGRYLFFLNSDDGSRLYIDGQMIVDNGGDHAPQEKRGEVDLTSGDHSILATFYNNGGGFELGVSWRPPGGRKQKIPSELLSHFGQPLLPLDEELISLDPVKVHRGRELFATLGCANCHEVSGKNLARNSNAPPLAALAENQGGCLSTVTRKGMPKFGLSDSQRASIREVLANRGELATKRTAADEIRYNMAQLNCYACHTRDGKGGPVDARLAYFRTTGEVDLGDEGRIPPHLTAVGAKLRTDWMNEVITNRGRVRPYMAVRMPQYRSGPAGHLAALFEAADRRENGLSAPEGALREAKLGRRLVGQGGLSCISCHSFANFKSLGIPAVDLTTMSKRLRYDWFRRYVVEPTALRPGTRMPSFWPGGEAVNKEILNGRTEPQINAIWTYLANKPETDLPPGLVQGKKEIVAESEPVIYRNFIAGAGTRAIGVGYPEKVNLAFDANNIRLAMLWQGPFIDASRHSSGRGEGFEPPLGNNVINLPAGTAFAILAHSEAPWPKTSGKEAGLKMGGYRLDSMRRPTFMYSFNDLNIEESFEPVPSEVDAFFKRTIRIKGENMNQLWFRAATGDIAQKAGVFVMNGKITMKFSGANPILRASGSQSEILVPVSATGDEAVIVEEIIW